MLEHCVTFVREKLDDYDLGKRLRGDRHRAEQMPKRAFEVSKKLGNFGIGGLVSVREAIFGKGDGARPGEGEEHRGLLGLGRGGEQNNGRGYGIYEGRYGYYEGMLYPSSFGVGHDGSRPEFADGMSESSGCVGPVHGHQEECVGECTLQTRRRSWDS